MKKISLCLLILCLAFSHGCSVLTNSQVKNINAFATTAKNYTDFPGEIIRKRTELVLEEKLVGTMLFSSVDRIKESIDTAQKTFTFQQQLADKLDVALQLIQQYASLLNKLSSENYVEDLNSNTRKLNDNLSDLVQTANSKLSHKIPAGVSSAITKVIFLVGERLTKNKQAKALKEFIPVGDTLIKITVKNLVEELNGLPDLFAGDRQKFINTYTTVVFSNPNRVEYSTLRQYLDALNNYDNLEALRQKSITAGDKLSNAHSRLNASLHEKRDFKEIFKETQDFIVSIQDLYKTFSRLTSHNKS